MKMFKLKIRTKILLVMLSLTVLTFCVIACFVIARVRLFGDYAAGASAGFGQTALNESKDALRAQAKDEIIAVTMGQAALIDTQLRRIGVEISMLANLCSRYTVDPANLTSRPTHFRSNLTDKEPSDSLSVASWHIPPNYELAKRDFELENFSRLQPIMKFVWRNNPGCDIVYLASANGLFIAYPWNAQPVEFDPRQREWFNAAASTNRTVWVGPYVSSTGNRLVLTCAKAARNGEGKLLAVCAIDIEIKKIANNLLASHPEPNSKAILLDAAGNILVRRDIDLNGATWKDEYQKQNMLQSPEPAFANVARNMVSGRRGVEDLRIPGEPTYYFAYAPIASNGWSLGIAIPKNAVIKCALNTEKNIRAATIRNQESINEYIRRTLLSFLVIGGGASLVIIITAMLLGAKIARPVASLKNQADALGMGNLEQKIAINTGDELEHFAGTLNQMAAELNSYIASLRETFINREKMNSELKVAKEIQSASLPPASPESFNDTVLVRAMMVPAREIGGDFYDYRRIDERRLYFAIGDVSGKGIPAALFMAMTKTLLSRETENTVQPDEILLQVNNILANDNESCMFVTVFCGFIDLVSGDVCFANGGHNPPLLGKNGGSFEYLTTTPGMAIGPYPSENNLWRCQRLTMAPGDTLFLYSDGVTEAMNDAGTVFGESHLRTVLNTAGTGGSPELLIADTMLEIKAHAEGCPQSDDITMLVLRFNPAGGNEYV